MNGPEQYGLIGFPLGHSFSRGFFSEKFEKEHISAVYSNFEIEDISMIEQILKATPNLKGFNVTIPYKEKVIPFLTSMSEEAGEIGAVNVIRVESKGGEFYLKGYNSDVVGFSNSIKPLIDSKSHKKALVLGTGGASKAVVYGLQKLGLDTQLVSRRKSEMCISYDELTQDLMEEYKVVVNCTPLGTFPNVSDAPNIPYHYLGKSHLLYDLVYNPAETEFLKRGKAYGATTKNGASMLELQAIEAWRIWNNK